MNGVALMTSGVVQETAFAQERCGFAKYVEKQKDPAISRAFSPAKPAVPEVFQKP